ncbi:capsular polysaccharide export protein, LipB/KpsS family [Halosimplex salinum]|uniref:capsular polysaccharide export protein, LipB/KpsS family n=1 Tax=Halosimplex salinum TaxID=1710538 RepID=UPI000F46F272|nr:hypothetical protein [Halosimplex salinum]
MSGLKREILRLGYRLNVEDHLLDAYFANSDRYDFAVDERIRSYELPDSEVDGRVLLPVVQGRDASGVFKYCIMAHAFRCRGYEPIVTLCDNDVAICHAREQHDDLSACALCHHHGENLFSAFGLDPVPLSALAGGESRPDPYALSDPRSLEYRGIRVSDYAEASARRFLRRYHFDLDDSGDRETYLRFLDTAMDIVDAGYAAIAEYDVDATLVNHAPYVYGGLFAAVAAEAGIASMTYASGYRDRTVMFGNAKNRSPMHQFSDEATIEAAVSEPLSGSQEARIDEIMEGRREGETTRFDVVGEADEALDSSADYEVTAGMFTNLIWDASLTATGGAFHDPFEWISATIETIADHGDVQLVIKTHPVEAMKRTNERVSEWITDQYGSLPGNVVLLPPETEVDTYRLIDQLDVGIVYNSTVGMEMPYFGDPVVVGGETHYRGAGFTYDPETKSEYEDTLSRLDELELTEEMRRTAKRYAYMFMVRTHVDFPFYETVDNQTRWLPVSHDDIEPGNVNFDTAVEGVLADGPVHTPE